MFDVPTTVSEARNLLERGLRRPKKIPRYVFGLLVPSARWGPEWRRADGVVTFEPGGYATSPRNRPEFAANCYYEASGLLAALEDHLERPPDTTLELGPGYGRLSPWIAGASGRHYGIDPDRGALERAANLYPDLGFLRGRAGALPFPDESVDVLVSWTVLQHVEDASIDAATAEIRRVLTPGGIAVCCERVRPPADDHVWPRSVETYAGLLEPLALVDVRDRPVEPTWSDAMATERPPEAVLVFRG